MQETTTLTVAGMTCDHCVRSVRQSIGALEGVHAVDVDLESGTVHVRSDAPISGERLAAAVEGAGYHVVA